MNISNLLIIGLIIWWLTRPKPAEAITPEGIIMDGLAPPDHVCPYCSGIFPTQAELEEHILVVHAVPSPQRRPPCGNSGDIDGDGWVSLKDADLVAQHVAGVRQLTWDEASRADVTGDGIIDIIDAMFIGQFVRGLRDTFPVCGIRGIR